MIKLAIDTLPYSVVGENKWKFINQYWTTYFEQYQLDTITQEQYKSLFSFTESKTYNLKRDKEKHLRGYLEAGVKLSHGKRIWICGSLKELSLFGYPLSYRALKNGIKRVTAFGEGEVGIYIRMITIDSCYNHIDNLSLTSLGGDEGWTGDVSGKFINDSVYVKTEILLNENDSVMKISKNKFIFHSNGTIERIEPVANLNE